MCITKVGVLLFVNYWLLRSLWHYMVGFRDLFKVNQNLKNKNKRAEHTQ